MLCPPPAPPRASVPIISLYHSDSISKIILRNPDCFNSPTLTSIVVLQCMGKQISCSSTVLYDHQRYWYHFRNIDIRDQRFMQCYNCIQTTTYQEIHTCSCIYNWKLDILKIYSLVSLAQGRQRDLYGEFGSFVCHLRCVF